MKTVKTAFEDGRYEGETKKSGGKVIPNGKGTYFYNNGDKYEGMFINGQKSGNGNFTFDDGECRYKGEFKDDLMSGDGVLRFKNGDLYEGEFENDEMNGKGVFYYETGSKYEGEFKDHDMHGYGIFYFPSDGVDRDQYEGDWVDGEKCGKGVLYYKVWPYAGNRYEGDWKDDEKNGKGILFFGNGDRYDGEWEDDEKSGKGIYYFRNGERYDGEWKEDKKHGKGVFYHKNGDKFEGEWKNGKKEGRGVCFYLDGRRELQLFKNGKYKKEKDLERNRSLDKLNEMLFRDYAVNNNNHEHEYKKNFRQFPFEEYFEKKASEAEKELFQRYFFIKSPSIENLMILEQFYRVQGESKDGIYKLKFERLKYEVWNEIVVFKMYKHVLLADMFDYPWMDDGFFDLKKGQYGWEKKELFKLKKQALKNLKEYCEKVIFPNLSKKGEGEEIVEERISKLCEELIWGEKSYFNRNDFRIDEEIKRMYEEEFKSSLVEVVQQILQKKDLFVDYLFQELKKQFVIEQEEEVILEYAPEKNGEDEEQETGLKYFGMEWKSKKFGFALFYKPVSAAADKNFRFSLIAIGMGKKKKSKKQNFLPVYYGSFKKSIYDFNNNFDSDSDSSDSSDDSEDSEEEEYIVPSNTKFFRDRHLKRFMKHGDDCREYSDKDGSLIFEGSFRNGLREGKGIEFFDRNQQKLNKKMRDYLKNSQSLIFEGNYKEGRRHGRGESFDPKTRKMVRGKWVDGILDPNSVFLQFECPEIDYDEIQKHLHDSKVIGKGGFGVVYTVKSSAFKKSFFQNLVKKFGKKSKKGSLNFSHKLKMGQNVNEVAVKIIQTKSRMEFENLFRRLKRGVRLCHSIRSIHILETFGLVKGLDKIGQIMELCDKSIDDIVSKENRTSSSILPLEEKIRILKETALGMKALHGRNVIHRDLKWGNVLMGFDKVVKLTDFDTVKEDQQWKYHKVSQTFNVGTIGFRSPEVYTGKKYSPKCDVYAFGLMIYSLLFSIPFPFMTQFQCPSCNALIKKELESNRLEKHIAEPCNLRPLLNPDEVSKYPEYLIELMIQCWDAHPFNRPTFEEIVLRFDLEDRKQFSKITLQFPSHPGVNDQKMFFTKPYERKKIIEWIEKKFNKNPIIPNENNENEEDEEEGEGEEEEENDQKTVVLQIEHDEKGTICLDEELETVFEIDKNPTFKILLNTVDESYVVEKKNVENNNSSLEVNKKMRIKYEKKYLEVKKEKEVLTEILKKRDLEDQKRLKNRKIEKKKLKSFLQKNQLLKKYEEEFSRFKI